jgi:hypothetical protein
MRQALIAATCLVLTGCSAARDGVRPLGSLDYRRDGKLMMVQARVNGAGPYWFIVDSGAPRSVIDPALAAELKLGITAQGSTTGTGPNAVPYAYTQPVRIALGGSAYDSTPYVIDLSGAPLPKEVRGLIGSELFVRHVVRVDPKAQRISWYDPKRAPGRSGATVLPLRAEAGTLYLKARIEPRRGVAIDRELRIDTGSESSVNDPSAAQATLIATTTLGNGLGGDFQGVSGKYRSVRFGPYVFRDFWGPGGNPPLIGMELLQRFVMTFDAPHGRIYLAPIGHLDAPVPHPPGIISENPAPRGR